MILKLMSIFTGRKIVWLEDFQGGIHRTIEAKGNPFNNRWCYVYPLTRVGHVVLNDDGTTSGKSSYIERWKYEGSE